MTQNVSKNRWFLTPLAKCKHGETSVETVPGQALVRRVWEAVCQESIVQ
jgi:hypothetical protein